MSLNVFSKKIEITLTHGEFSGAPFLIQVFDPTV
jgi:hypothetical protein